MTVGAGEYGTVTLRVGDQEIGVWKEYHVQSHFLTATDGFHFVVGDEVLTDALLDLLVPGRKCTLLLDGAPQCTGYIDVVDASGDRMSGNVVVINGCDVMSPVVRSEIDPRRRFPDKMPLDQLISDILKPFGFTQFLTDNADNINVAANRGLRQPKHGSSSKKRHKRSRAPKPLKQYPMPKSRPHHGESFWQFLCRLTQREGLWIWPTVLGDGIVVGQPDYDQEPVAELRRSRNGATNNVLRGGIRRDGTDQPSYIIATGRIPPREVQHSIMRCVLDNPLTGIQDVVGNAPKRLTGGQANDSGIGEQSDITTLIEGAPERLQDRAFQDALSTSARQLSAAGEGGSFSSAVIQQHREQYKWTTRIPAAPIEMVNTFASLVARPKYIKDDESHTIEQLQNFARREMSLHLRHAFVGTYEIEGHRFENGVIPQVDMVVSVKDDRSRFSGPMWILSRTFEKSRTGGTKTRLELLPLHAIEF